MLTDEELNVILEALDYYDHSGFGARDDLSNSAREKIIFILEEQE